MYMSGKSAYIYAKSTAKALCIRNMTACNDCYKSECLLSLLDTSSFIKVIFKPVPNSYAWEMGIHWNLLQCLVLALDFLPNTPVHLQTYLNMNINDRLRGTGFIAFPSITDGRLQLMPSHEQLEMAHSNSRLSLFLSWRGERVQKDTKKPFAALAAGPKVTTASESCSRGSSKRDLREKLRKQVS